MTVERHCITQKSRLCVWQKKNKWNFNEAIELPFHTFYECNLDYIDHLFIFFIIFLFCGLVDKMAAGVE